MSLLSYFRTNLRKDVNAASGLPISFAACNQTEVDLATDADVVVSDAPAILLGVYVNVVVSAHSVNLVDGSTTKIILPASLAAGTNYNFNGAAFDTSLIVNIDNAATGKIVIFWLPQ